MEAGEQWDGLDAPGFRRRACYAVALLAGFYALILATALLFATPALAIIGATLLDPQELAKAPIALLGAIVFSLGGAGLLLAGAWRARPPPHKPHGRRLAREEAPRLFEQVATLARTAGVRPPDEIYVTARAEAGVTQSGGLWNEGTRVLFVGLPLLDALTVQELRAVVCHELGHFAGGDTRLVRLGAHAHDLFASLIASTSARPFAQRPSSMFGFALVFAREITERIALVYARTYFRLSAAMSRRMELAADRFAARTAGPGALAAALTRVGELASYDVYLATDVAQAARRGVMPADLLPGFQAFRARFLAGAEGRALLERIHTQPSSDTDTHPSLIERISATRAVPERDLRQAGEGAYREGGADRALDLLANPAAMEAWLSLESRPLVGEAVGLRTLSWTEIAQRVYLPEVEALARAVAARLHASLPGAHTVPQMFAALVGAMESGRGETLALALEPAIAGLSSDRAARAASITLCNALSALYRGALLERGATVAPALGSGGGPEILFEGRPVLAEQLVARAFARDHQARAELQREAARLAE